MSTETRNVATLNTIFKFVICNTCHSFAPNLSLQLFMKRMKVASSSEKQALLELDPSFMSDEEDGVEAQVGSWVVKSPPWHSPQLSSLLKKLQGKVESHSGSSHPKNNRVQGEPSTCPAPPSSPTWALRILERQPSKVAFPTVTFSLSRVPSFSSNGYIQQ